MASATGSLPTGVYYTGGDHELLAIDVDHFSNYTLVDSGPHASEELHRHADPGYLAKFDTLAATENYLKTKRPKPILSKSGLLMKTAGGKTKKRLILGAKESKVKFATGRHEHIVLPLFVMPSQTSYNETYMSYPVPRTRPI
eukprot:4986278-Amphidinium_carterae.1